MVDFGGLLCIVNVPLIVSTEWPLLKPRVEANEKRCEWSYRYLTARGGYLSQF